MSKMGNLHFQAQEDARDGTMDKKSFLDEYGTGALDIWEEFNGEDPDEYRKKSYFGQSLEEQSDYEIQTEHWGSERA
jgi:hypothetical protein